MKKILCLVMCGAIALSLAACKKFDDDYGKRTENKQPETSNTATEQKNEYKDIKIPEIKSDDSVMPAYLDISLYDEENYADIYLGEDFEYSVTYDGVEIKVPTNYETLTSQGWTLVASDEYNENSQILVRKSLTVDFVNANNKKITAIFYNNGITSVSLKSCPIVKFMVKENALFKSNSQYGDFTVNGVDNASAITDIIELLGAPSHFYRVSDEQYYLDWFITAKDRRSEITIYVDTTEDHIDAIEFAYY